ncbi:MAG TPA: 50S ribosomal protein L4 [Blastocatellia bacterium]|jgi:large subunit ribosomal protein L4|nr:50S ribosomal protein L4 [Blastocatellia bacterium]
MPVVKVKNLNNEEVGELELPDAVFDAPLNKALVYSAVTSYLANQRAGTVATKTRGNTSGSGRKLWKQKGTGRARVSSIRSPLWKGGGNVHGPQPRDWSYQLPKKMKRGAICSVLSERLREGGIVVVDSFELASPKTKDFVAALDRLGLTGHTLVVDSLNNHNLTLSSRNLPNVRHVTAAELNIYQLLTHEKLALSKAAAGELNQRFAKQKGGSA